MCKGDYSSPSFLQAALREQDVVIIAFGFEAPLDLQECIIDAAGKAGVKWILPNEWSSDGENEKLCKVFSLLGEKRKFREQIERLDLDGGRGGWVGVANNPWFDYVSLLFGLKKTQMSSQKNGVNKALESEEWMVRHQYLESKSYPFRRRQHPHYHYNNPTSLSRCHCSSQPSHLPFCLLSLITLSIRLQE